MIYWNSSDNFYITSQLQNSENIRKENFYSEACTHTAQGSSKNEKEYYNLRE